MPQPHPPLSQNGDFQEICIPEQFQHKLILDGATPAISADVSDLYAH